MTNHVPQVDPEPRPRLRAVVLLALGILLVLPPLLVSLPRSDLRFHMEVMTVASSQFTWMSVKEGNAGAWLIPEWNTAPRIHKPPLTSWVNMLGWSDLDPATVSPDVLVARARYLGVAAALLGVVGAFLSGWALGGRTLAWSALLARGSAVLMIKQARLASYDTYLLGFAGMAMACGIWALQRGPRALLWWLGCGVFWGLATLAKGPISTVFVGAPLVAMIVWSTSGRRVNATGFALASLVALAMFAPWKIYMLQTVPDATVRVLEEYRSQRDEFQTPLYYLTLLPILFPWTFAFLVGLRDAWKLRRNREFAGPALALVWFATVFFIMSIPGAKQQRYIVPILPAAALLAAFAFSDRIRGDAPWPKLLRAHGGLLMTMSVIFPLFLILQPLLVAKGALKAPELVGIPAWIAALSSVALLALAWWCRGAIAQRSSSRVLVLTTLWMTIGASVGYYGYVQSHHGIYRHRAQTEAIRNLVGQHPIRSLYPPGSVRYHEEPGERFFFYVRRTAPRIHPADVANYVRSDEPAFLIVRDTEERKAFAEAAGLLLVTNFHCGAQARVLYGNAPALASLPGRIQP